MSKELTKSKAIIKAATQNDISDIENGLLVYLDQDFYSKTDADYLFDQLKKQVVYDIDPKIKIFGKELSIPRNQTAYGDPETTYTFSGLTVDAKPWLPILLDIKTDVENATGKKFNFCLINYYADGSKYIGYHKDDERDLGSRPWIASISLGQTRKFYFKADDPTLDVVKTILTHGSLCIMIDPTNVHWKHSVPKETIKNCSNPRINLTFRIIQV